MTKNAKKPTLPTTPTPPGTTRREMNVELNPDDKILLEQLTSLMNLQKQMTECLHQCNQTLLAISKHVFDGILLAQPDADQLPQPDFKEAPDHSA
jgi:hypothetical protein